MRVSVTAGLNQRRVARQDVRNQEHHDDDPGQREHRQAQSPDQIAPHLATSSPSVFNSWRRTRLAREAGSLPSLDWHLSYDLLSIQNRTNWSGKTLIPEILVRAASVKFSEYKGMYGMSAANFCWIIRLSSSRRGGSIS